MNLCWNHQRIRKKPSTEARSNQHCGVSLNNVFLTGPDLNNSVLGVLIPFRKELVTITAGIQQIFLCFLVREDHRNYLRCLRYRNNDMSKDIIEHRTKVHVTAPRFAVAIYGLRRAAQECELDHGTDTKQFFDRHLYIEDGLMSLPTNVEAIDILKRTRTSLSGQICGYTRSLRTAEG